MQRIMGFIVRACLAVACFALLPAGGLKAADYPTRSPHIIVGYPAGGSTDIVARLIGDWLSKRLGQQFIVENRPGAGNNLATEAVTKAAPDGYTLILVNPANTINASLYKNLNFVFLRDIDPVAGVIRVPNVMEVHPSVPAKTVAELLALAHAKPGTLNYGSSGPGSNYHMAGELLKNLTGIDIVHVPYKGSTGARNDILSGQIQILFDSVPTMAPQIKAGMVRALGTSGKTRSAILPDVPTMAEAGVPGFNATLWVGFMAPANTPKPIVDKLHDEITKILRRPDIKQAWEKTGATPIVVTQPEFTSFMETQVAKWAEVIKTNRIAPIN